MPIDGQMGDIPRITWLYFCCKLGGYNKIVVAGFRYLRRAAKEINCDREYEEEEEDDI